MSSLNGIEPLSGGAYYTASKFAIEGFSPLGSLATDHIRHMLDARLAELANWSKLAATADFPNMESDAGSARH